MVSRKIGIQLNIYLFILVCWCIFWKKSSAHQGSIYLIINTVIFWNIISISNKCFYCNIFVNVIYCCDAALYFQHHYSSLQCHMIFRNHYNMLIYCSRNSSYQCYYQNSFCFFIFLWKLWCIFQDSLTNRTFKKCFKLEILCNIINVIAVIFDQCNASLLHG